MAGEKKPKRPRGTGSLFTQPGSSVIWCQFYAGGRRYRESTGTDNSRKAQKYLSDRLAEVSQGSFNPEATKVTVADLVDTKLTTDRNNGSKSIEDTEARWTLHLAPYFGSIKAANVTTPLLSKYVAKRLEEKAKPATINRELALLRAAFYLAADSTPPRVQRVPKFPMLEERNTRTGFLTDQQYDKLAAECAKVGLWLRTLLELGATYGWRRSELLNLPVNKVDLSAKVIRLEPGTTKNNDGREVSMTSTLVPLLTACVEGKAQDDRVITWPDGTPVLDFRATWSKVCTAAGVPNLLFHDLRRTAARALRRAGVAEGVIMSIGGWKTRSIFERYAIVAQSDIKDAMSKLEQQRQKVETEEAKESDLDHSSAIVAQETVQAGALDQTDKIN